MAKFLQKVPAADPAALLQQQLVAQQNAAMSSPKAGDKLDAKGKQGGEGEISTKSFLDVFRSRTKEKAKAKPSAAIKKNAIEANMSDFLSK